MPRSATKLRILATALDLFNLEGEAEVSASDIAAVLGMSPGNLHYHFPGKPPLIEALFEDFEVELRQVLQAPVARPLAIDDNWVFLFIVWEEIWDFRFFYRDPHGLLARVPNLREPFRALLALKEATADALLAQLEDLGALSFLAGEREALSRRLAQHMTVWLNYRSLRSGMLEPTKKEAINEGVHQALLMIAPYVDGNAELFREGLEAAATDAPV